MSGTETEPPPIPRGTEINPIHVPIRLFILKGISLGVSPIFSLKKIKNNPIQKAKTEKIKTNLGVSRLDAKTVPNKTPPATNKPNDFINLKSFSPGKTLSLEIIHFDGSKKVIKLNHTFNSQQIDWYINGSALNLIKSNNLI